MIAFTYYILKVIGCSGILFLYYHAFLRNRVFHQWNRFYLLAAVLLSLLLPLLRFELVTTEPTEQDLWRYVSFLQSADRYMEAYTAYAGPQWAVEDWWRLGYLTVSAGLFFALLFSLYKIIRLIQTHPVSVYDRFSLLPTREPGSPFSFLHYIFWNQEISLESSAGQQIFQHELVHVQEKHTWDKLFLQLVLLIAWCNPFFWLIRRELRFIHEFIADRKAVGDDTSAFAAMILQAAYPGQSQALRIPFFQTSIKRRLHMLTLNKNPKMAYLGRLIALPLLAVVTVAFTVRTGSNSGRSLLPTVPSLTDTLPRDPSSIKSVNVKKGKQPGEGEIEILYKDGRKEVLTEKELNAKTRIAEKTSPSTDSSQFKGGGLNGQSAQLPLFLLDGKEVTKAVVDALNPTMISSVNVLKGESATAKYGAKGKHGVIEITAKNEATGTPMKLEENGQPIMQLNGHSKVEMNESGAVRFEDKELVVNGKKQSNSTGGSNDVVAVIGKKMEGGPAFEKAEFLPSVDPEEWRRFLDEQTQNIIRSAGGKIPGGRYTVNVRFLVEKDGSLSNLSILNDPGHGLGARVLEMMKKAPRWKPAIQNQQVVRSFHTQAITFVVADT